MMALSLAVCSVAVGCLAPAAPLIFEANAGQAGARVQFLARMPDFTVSLSPDNVTIRTSGAQIVMHFPGGQLSSLEGVGRLPGVVNYLAGNDPSQWLRRIPTFAQVRGAKLYPGVDIVFHGGPTGLEYDFEVAPGADLSRIDVEFSGARSVRIGQQGDLLVDTGSAELRQKRPGIYQEGKPVEGRYRLTADNQVSLVVDSYDRKRPLLIDPELLFARPVAKGSNNFVNGVAGDSQGNIYVTGNTNSPLSGASNTASYQVFVTKFDPTGQNIVYSTYLAPSNETEEDATGIAVDPSGSAYVTGAITSGVFPVTSGAVSAASSGAFVAKLSPAGDSLVYAAIVADGYTLPAAIALDSQGSAYLTGTTQGDLPVTPGAYWSTPPPQPPGGNIGKVTPRGVDGFVLKLNPQGTSVVYASYTDTPFVVPSFGSPDSGINAIAVDGSGNAYVTGFDHVFKLNPTGSALVYSSRTDPWGVYYTGNAIAVDAAGYAYVAGMTDFGHAFVTKLDPDGHSYFNTGNNILVGEQYEYGAAVAVDSAGHVFVAGNTLSANLPLRAPLQEAFSQATAFLAELDSYGNLLFSTYVGDNQFFQVIGLAVDPAGKPVLCGNTYGGQYTYNGVSFVAQIGSPLEPWLAKYDVSAVPSLRLDGLANLASQLTTPLSPGELVVLRGAGFGPGTQLFFDGQSAAAITSGPAPVALVPATLAGKAFTVAYAELGSQRSNSVLIPVVTAAPGVFTSTGAGAGQALAFNQDGSLNSQTNPAKGGSLLTFYATGLQPAVTPTVYINSEAASNVQAALGTAPGVPDNVVEIQAAIPPDGLQAGVASMLYVSVVENSLPSQQFVWIYATK